MKLNIYIPGNGTAVLRWQEPLQEADTRVLDLVQAIAKAKLARDSAKIAALLASASYADKIQLYTIFSAIKEARE